MAPMVTFYLTIWPGQESAWNSWSPGARLFTVAAVLGAIALLVHLARKLQGGGPDSPERKEAIRLGMTVSDVERDLPQFSRGNRSCKLVRGTCARYSLSRPGAVAGSNWSLLQRTEKEGAQFPNGFLLQGEASAALRQALAKLATEFAEDYSEFEGTATDVSVYWEEYGGAERVQRIYRVLRNLAGL